MTSRRRSSRAATEKVDGHPVAVYDNGGKTADRYTVVFTDMPERGRGMYECLGMSSYPSHPQGISQWSSAQLGRHLGKKVRFGELPQEIQRHVRARLARS